MQERYIFILKGEKTDYDQATYFPEKVPLGVHRSAYRGKLWGAPFF